MSVRSRLLDTLLPAAVALTAIACGQAPADSQAVRVATETRVEHAGDADAYAIRRDRLIGEIETSGMVGDERVLAAIRRVPRHAFVRPEHLDEAYENHPLPIGEGQTISQPLIVAVMTETLHIDPGDRVLEVGTGSGYQAAVLACLAARVYTIERDPVLFQSAVERLRGLGMNEDAVVLLHGDGSEGYPPAAPYDAILVAAASPGVPDCYLEQLIEGGRLVIPVGGLEHQEFRKVRKWQGKPVSRVLGHCRFVPLKGRHGWKNA